MQSTVTISDMKAGNSTNAMSPEVEDLVRTTVKRINSSGGKVVGLIGFSQGTKVVAGLLKGTEARTYAVRGVARDRSDHRVQPREPGAGPAHPGLINPRGCSAAASVRVA